MIKSIILFHTYVWIHFLSDMKFFKDLLSSMSNPPKIFIPLCDRHGETAPPPLPLCPAAATVVNSISAIWRNFVISKKNVSVVDNHSPWSKLNIFTYLLIYIQLTLENYLDIWRACLKSFKLRLTWQSWTVSEKPEPVWRV